MLELFILFFVTHRLCMQRRRHFLSLLVVVVVVVVVFVILVILVVLSLFLCRLSRRVSMLLLSPPLSITY